MNNRKSDTQKRSTPVRQSVYFRLAMLREIHREAKRLERRVSWVVMRAWRIARSEIASLGGPPALTHETKAQAAPESERPLFEEREPLELLEEDGPPSRVRLLAGVRDARASK